MTDASDFLLQGIEQVRLELTDIVGGANLHLKPETVTRSLAARVRARLKVLEIVLRRLILLMALALKLDPVVPRPARAAQPLPEGVEDVTASFRAHLKRRRIALMPPPLPAPGTFPEICAARPSGPVPARPLLAHAAALHCILQAPEAAARRLARLLQRMKRRGEAQPYCLPLGQRHRMRPELALLAGVLPELVNRALDGWNDTG